MIQPENDAWVGNTAITNEASARDVERGNDGASSFGEEEAETEEANATERPEEGNFKRKFSARIVFSKLLVIGVLIGSATVFSVLTYRFISQQETKQFEQQFTSQAKEMIKVISSSAINCFAGLKSFSNMATSTSLLESNDWPLITLPNFELAASDYIAATSATFVALAPLVAEEDRYLWERFSVDNNKWIKDGMRQNLSKPEDMYMEIVADSIRPFIWVPGFRQGEPIREPAGGPYAPLWQQYPPPSDRNAINFNLMQNKDFRNTMEKAIYSQRGVQSKVFGREPILTSNVEIEDNIPKTVIFQPVYKEFTNKTEVVAFILALVPLDVPLQGALSDGSLPVYSIVKSSCSDEEESFTYRVNGEKADYKGAKDLHNLDYDNLEVSADFSSDIHGVASACNYSIHIYPSDEMRDHFQTTTPFLMTIAVLLIFILICLAFLLYDCLVQQKTRQAVEAANKTNQIIHNLFPAQVHDRLFNADASNSNHSNTSSPRKRRKRREFGQKPAKLNLRNFLSDDSKTASETTDSDEGDNQIKLSKPIADLFPNCTVMFCDIAGFTAWSSVREPFMVFQLLETVYNSFDDIAQRRKVFKVETIGDCYLAVAGLPTPRKDHAVVMTRFASDCMTQFDCLSRELEVDLGPGTSDLKMRFGLHSGPVTAGVLRGEKTRFQLFGDTVNTASRMESTGEKERIQISTATANLLNEAHKGHWCERRKDPIVAKGKGEMITYWVDPKTAVAGSLASFSTSSRGMQVPQNPEEAYSAGLDTSGGDLQGEGLPKLTTSEMEYAKDSAQDNRESQEDTICPKLQRSVSFVSGVLLSLLRRIVARRLARGEPAVGQTQATRQARMSMQPEPETLVIDEMKEFISFPQVISKATDQLVDPETVELPREVVEQLHSFVTVVALMYQDNPFHSFYHATNTILSASKLLTRIASPDNSTDNTNWNEKRRGFGSKNDNSCDIFKDPLVQFSIIFSVLIHDCDHPGVPNSVLVNNETPIAQHYQNKSVAEQNSLDVAWEVLCDDAYSDLCACIFADSSEELQTFRQLLVNSVLATDIVDPQLNQVRQRKWDKAFNGSNEEETKPGVVQFVAVREDMNRKATIMIEHLVQASDVAHCMQHWSVYLSWSERLFEEQYSAFLAGHLEKDPSKSWYERELGFFDGYIIPLANKLDAFGVDSTEFLCYALENRHEWERNGKNIVDGYIRKYKPSKDHFHNDLEEDEDAKIGACRELQKKDDACSLGSTSSHRMARPVDCLFNHSYHTPPSTVPPLA